MATNIGGYYVIAQTPFTADGSVDRKSIETLSDFYFKHGATGLTVLGISGEAGRLSLQESVDVAEAFIKSSPEGSVVVGVSNSSLAQLGDLTDKVARLGAGGVMITPAPGLKTEEEVLNYYKAVFERIGSIPVVLQDYPAASGVAMSVDTICKLAERHAQIEVLKHEDFPGLAKLSRLKEKLADRLVIMTGSNGLYLPLELERGADGPMAGFSFPEVLAKVAQHHRAGERDKMLDLFDRYLPLLRYEAQGLFGIAVRKEILRRRGAISCGVLRGPAPTLSSIDHREIDTLLDRIQRREGAATCIA